MISDAFDGLKVADTPDIPPDRRLGKVRNLKTLTSKATSEPFVVWECVVLVDGKPASVDGSSSTNTGPRSKPRRWMKAILRREIAPGEFIRKEDLVDKYVTIDTNVTEDGWPFVEDIRPLDQRTLDQAKADMARAKDTPPEDPGPATPAVPPTPPPAPTAADAFQGDFDAKVEAVKDATFSEPAKPSAPPTAPDSLPF